MTQILLFLQGTSFVMSNILGKTLGEIFHIIVRKFLLENPDLFRDIIYKVTVWVILELRLFKVSVKFYKAHLRLAFTNTRRQMVTLFRTYALLFGHVSHSDRNCSQSQDGPWLLIHDSITMDH